MVGWLATLAVLVRVLAVGLPLALAFVVVTALTATHIARDAWQVLVGSTICLGLPLLVRGRALAWMERRGKKGAPPSAAFFVAAGNLLIMCTLAFGFADDVGRALRRHGDWFLGERNGVVARNLRASIGGAAGYLEHFDPLPELAPVVVMVAPPPLPPDFVGPPPVPTPVAMEEVWYHPLMGPERKLPGYAIRRFGAARNVHRPPECELGHCGVDIGTTVGEPVLAVFDGKVDRINLNPNADAISGIFIILSHKDGTVRSRYIHLDSVSPDLKVGDTVHGGQIIGRLGRTGVKNSAAHLHFGLSIREGGRGRDVYVDPEPYLRRWKVVDPPANLVAATGPS